MKKLMLGASISALMLGAAFAQSSMAPKASDQSKPPAMAPAKPGANQPESSAANKSDKAKIENKANNQAAANTGNEATGKPKVVASQSPDEFLASSFDGNDVIGANGKSIGSVGDMRHGAEWTLSLKRNTNGAAAAATVFTVSAVSVRVVVMI